MDIDPRKIAYPPSTGVRRIHETPLVTATAASLAGYGCLVDDPGTFPIEIVRWPAQGWRPIDENTGDGMKLALDAGAALDGENLFNGVWAVVSKMTREDGYLARYAHLIDMSKPGCIAVNERGERFGNEASVSFVDSMHAAGAPTSCHSRTAISIDGVGHSH